MSLERENIYKSKQSPNFQVDKTIYLPLPFQYIIKNIFRSTVKFYSGKVTRVYNSEYVDVEIGSIKLKYINVEYLYTSIPKGEESVPDNVIPQKNPSPHYSMKLKNDKNHSKRCLFPKSDEVGRILNDFISELRPYNSSLGSKGQQQQQQSRSQSQNIMNRTVDFFNNILSLGEDPSFFRGITFENPILEDRDWVNELSPSMMIDIKSPDSIWYEGTITDVKEDTLKIKYNTNEEWVSKDSLRISPHGYHVYFLLYL